MQVAPANGQQRYLCDIDESDEWTERIGFLLDDPDVARRFGEDACKLVWKLLIREKSRKVS